eukprot:g5834.t1
MTVSPHKTSNARSEIWKTWENKVSSNNLKRYADIELTNTSSPIINGSPGLRRSHSLNNLNGGNSRLSRDEFERRWEYEQRQMVGVDTLRTLVKHLKEDNENNKTPGCCCGPGSCTSFLHFVQGSAPGMLELFNSSSFYKDGSTTLPIFDFFINVVFRSIGQVAFCDNPWSGLIILIAMLMAESMQGPVVYGVCATIIANLFAWALFGSEGREAVRHGIHGFNGFLVGLALPIFVNPTNSWSGFTPDFDMLFAITMLSFFTVVLGAALNNVTTKYWKTPVFTLPFNIATLLFLFMSENKASHFNVNMDLIQPSPLSLTYEQDANKTSFNPENFFVGLFKGVSEIYIVDSGIAGFMMIIAILLYSRISAVAAVIASVLGMIVGTILGTYTDTVALGLWGYNPILTVIALWGVFIVPTAKGAMVALFAACMCCFVQSCLMRVLAPWGLPVLTLPFVLTTMIFMMLNGTVPCLHYVKDITTPESHYHVWAKERRSQRRARRKEWEERIVERRMNGGGEVKNGEDDRSSPERDDLVDDLDVGDSDVENFGP